MDTAINDTLPEAAQALAEAQAEKDREFLEALRKKQVSEVILSETEEEPGDPGIVPHMPMSRAERRQRVKFYARLLAETERQTPYVNPTIVPRSERRRRKGGRRA